MKLIGKIFLCVLNLACGGHQLFCYSIKINGDKCQHVRQSQRDRRDKASFLQKNPASHSFHSAGHDLTATTARSVSLSVSSGNSFTCFEVRKSLQGEGGHFRNLTEKGLFLGSGFVSVCSLSIKWILIRLHRCTEQMFRL